jgi:hypothetical protein
MAHRIKKRGLVVILLSQNYCSPMHPGWLPEKSERLVTILLAQNRCSPMRPGLRGLPRWSELFSGSQAPQSRPDF